VAPARLRIVLDDVGAGDVGRHQVGRELDARELQVEHVRHRAHQQRLRQARDADDQAVAAGEERQHYLFDDGRLANDDLAELRHHAVAAVLHAVGEGDIVGGVQGRLGVDGHITLHLRSFGARGSGLGARDSGLGLAGSNGGRRFSVDVYVEAKARPPSCPSAAEARVIVSVFWLLTIVSWPFWLLASS